MIFLCLIIFIDLVLLSENNCKTFALANQNNRTNEIQNNFLDENLGKLDTLQLQENNIVNNLDFNKTENYVTYKKNITYNDKCKSFNDKEIVNFDIDNFVNTTAKKVFLAEYTKNADEIEVLENDTNLQCNCLFCKSNLYDLNVQDATSINKDLYNSMINKKSVLTNVDLKCKRCNKKIIDTYFNAKHRDFVCLACHEFLQTNKFMQNKNFSLNLSNTYNFTSNKSCKELCDKKFSICKNTEKNDIVMEENSESYIKIVQNANGFYNEIPKIDVENKNKENDTIKASGASLSLDLKPKIQKSIKSNKSKTKKAKNENERKIKESKKFITNNFFCSICMQDKTGKSYKGELPNTRTCYKCYKTKLFNKIFTCKICKKNKKGIRYGKKQINLTCGSCHVMLKRKVEFDCLKCNSKKKGQRYGNKDSGYTCDKCYRIFLKLKNVTCEACGLISNCKCNNKSVSKSLRLSIFGRRFFVENFECSQCGLNVHGKKYHGKPGDNICKKCSLANFRKTSFVCGKCEKLKKGNRYNMLDNMIICCICYNSCRRSIYFICVKCNKKKKGERYGRDPKKLTCEACYVKIARKREFVCTCCEKTKKGHQYGKRKGKLLCYLCYTKAGKEINIIS